MSSNMTSKGFGWPSMPNLGRIFGSPVGGSSSHYAKVSADEDSSPKVSIASRGKLGTAPGDIAMAQRSQPSSTGDLISFDEPAASTAAAPARPGSSTNLAAGADISRPQSAPPAGSHRGSGDDDEPSTSGDEAGAARELLIYALPLYKHKDLIFLPVCAWKEPPKTGMVSGTITAVQDKASKMWNGLKEKGEGSISHRVYQAGQRVVESVSPEERLMRGIPSNVQKIIIYHPTTVAPDDLAERLKQMGQDVSARSTGKAAVAGLFLPIAFGLDLLVIPGIHVLTAYTAWEFAKDAASAKGGKRLTRYISQDGRGDVRVNYVADDRLDKYLEIVADSLEGCLSEDDILGLCDELNQPELLQSMFELRNKHMRATQQLHKSPNSSSYSLLRSTSSAGALSGGGASNGGGGGAATGGGASYTNLRRNASPSRASIEMTER